MFKTIYKIKPNALLYLNNIPHNNQNMDTDYDILYFGALLLITFTVSAFKTTIAFYTTGEMINLPLCWEFPTLMIINPVIVMLLERKGCFPSIEHNDLIKLTLILTFIFWMCGTFSGMNALFGTNRYYGC